LKKARQRLQGGIEEDAYSGNNTHLEEYTDAALNFT
jgi:hypothetical protein